MRFKVPQNIDIEDRILGPLTMVQFIYAVIGGGACYTIFMSIPAPFSYFLMVPVALFVIGLIFVKINERPFLAFLVAMIEFLSTPKQRVWKHVDMPDLGIQVYQVKKDNGPVVQSKHLSREQISAIAKRLDNNN